MTSRRNNLLKEVCSQSWKKRSDAVSQLIRKFGLLECKPIEKDGMNRAANGTHAFLKCASPGCIFRINIRQANVNKVQTFKVVPTTSNLLHTVRLTADDGSTFTGDCMGRYEATVVRLLFNFCFIILITNFNRQIWWITLIS
jgi:hypothetical protein